MDGPTGDDRELIHFSDKPWSDYAAADYSLEEWHRACLIHVHDGEPQSKQDCKLPIKTPGGVVNRNGVHAAAAALSGARGGVNAPLEEKQKAAKALISLYKQMEEDPPDSLVRAAGLNPNSLAQSGEGEVVGELSRFEKVLEHYGIRGMKWGIRRRVGKDGTVVKTDPGKPSGKSMSEETKKSADFEKAEKAYVKAKTEGIQSLSNDELKSITKRVQAEQEFRRLSETDHAELRARVERLRLEEDYARLSSKAAEAKKSKGRKMAEAILSTVSSQISNIAQSKAQEFGASIAKEMFEGAKSGRAPSSTAPFSRKSAKKEPFQVNPDSVRFVPNTSTDLARR